MIKEITNGYKNIFVIVVAGIQTAVTTLFVIQQDSASSQWELQTFTLLNFQRPMEKQRAIAETCTLIWQQFTTLQI